MNFFVYTAIKITLQWILRLFLLVALCLAGYMLLFLYIADPSSQYYEPFATKMSDMSKLHIPLNKQNKFQQKLSYCINTAKVLTYWEAINKCTPQNKSK